MMCEIRYTPNLHHALADVTEDRVVYHPGNGGVMAGWYWAGDGHMTQAEQDDLSELLHAGLIGIGPAPRCRRDGNPVARTAEGAARLVLWNERTAQIDRGLQAIGGAA